MTIFACVVLAGVCIALSVPMWGLKGQSGLGWQVATWINAPIIAAVVVFLVWMATMTIRGYSLSDDGRGLCIHQWLGVRTVPLPGTRESREVMVDPVALKGALRLWGNGGLFRFSGLHRNGKYGNMDLFVTSPAHCVVITGGEGSRQRPLILSPKNPETFAEMLKGRSLASLSVAD